MADVAETVDVLLPSIEKFSLLYFTATKAAQNDTITFSDYRKVYWAASNVEPASGDWSADTVTIDDSTINMINLTGSTIGTVHGIALLVK